MYKDILEAVGVISHVLSNAENARKEVTNLNIRFSGPRVFVTVTEKKTLMLNSDREISREISALDND